MTVKVKTLYLSSFNMPGSCVACGSPPGQVWEVSYGKSDWTGKRRSSVGVKFPLCQECHDVSQITRSAKLIYTLALLLTLGLFLLAAALSLNGSRESCTTGAFFGLVILFGGLRLIVPLRDLFSQRGMTPEQRRRRHSVQHSVRISGFEPPKMFSQDMGWILFEFENPSFAAQFSGMNLGTLLPDKPNARSNAGKSSKQHTVVTLRGEDKTYRKIGPLSVGLFNLTGVGLGYFLIKRYLRGAIHLVGTIALIVIASLTRAAHFPGIWIAVFAGWWLWMFIDGWRQGLKYEEDTSMPVPVPGRAYKYLLIVMAITEIIGVAGLQAVGYLKFNAGVNAFEASEFARAQEHFQFISQYLQLTLSPNVMAAENYLGETSLLIDAETHRAKSQHEDAIASYETYLSRYPSGSVAYARQQTADSYMSWAEQLHQSGGFESSINKYETVLANYPANTDEVITTNKIVSVYFDWAKALRTEERFEDALQKYDCVEKIPQTAGGISQLKTSRAETYVEWIGALRTDHKYPESIDKSRKLSNEYPDFYSAEELYSDMASIYREWAEDERRSARFASAIEKYRTLMNDYPDTRAANGIDEMTIAQTYLECGESLLSQQKYSGAMDCYTNLKEATQDKNMNDAAKTGYDTALKDLSLDTGTDGSQVISETKTLACKGDRATSPAVDLEKKEPGKALSCDSKIILPDDLEPVDPGHFRYVVKVETGTDTIQTCPYSTSDQPGIAAAHIIRQVQWLKVSLVRTTTGTIWAERKFTGDKPPRCPSNYFFSVTHVTEIFPGTEPDISKISEWLKQVIK